MTDERDTLARDMSARVRQATGRERKRPLLLSSEHAEQVALFAWALLHEGRYPELRWLYAVPNWAGVKGPREGAARKAEGVRAGVPDICLPVPRGGFAGLYIEMKYGDNTPTARQREWIAGLRTLGHRVEVCYGREEAQAVIENYLAAVAAGPVNLLTLEGTAITSTGVRYLETDEGEMHPLNTLQRWLDPVRGSRIRLTIDLITPAAAESRESED